MKVLVTLDGSPLSEAALEPPARFAEASGAEIGLLTVGEPPPQTALPRVEGRPEYSYD